MLKAPFLPKNWIGANENFESSKWVLIGMPYDGTCSNRPGARFAPETVRLASWGLEDYSPIQNREIMDTSFYDAGELEFPLGNRDETLRIIKDTAREVLELNKFWFGIGGEHLVTLPAIEAYLEKYNDLAVIHFDAHADLRDDYLGETFSHATVMKRIADKIGAERLIQIGIRSGTKEEFIWMNENKTLVKDKNSLQEKIKKLKDIPVFVSVDLDVLDPSIMSGTGTPEAGGMSFNEFMSWLLELKGLNVVGADVVELAPHYDSTGVSTVIAAKVIREMLIFVS
jgi:agmatinase